MRKKNKVIVRTFYIGIFIALGWLAVKSFEIQGVVNSLESQIDAAQLELDQVQKKVEELKIEKENMDTPEYIEKIAREKLGMVKEDDIVFKQK